MSTRTEKMLEEIRSRLSRIATDIRMDNIAGLYDRNGHMERFFKQILNALYGLNLVSTNVKFSNYPAIDLKDATRRVAYQVTSTNTSQKITHTIDIFLKNGLDKEFDSLNFLILRDIEGPKMRSGSNTTVDYDIFTIYDLSRMISDLDDEAKISEIRDIVMIEYLVGDGSVINVKAGAKYNLTSIQRLIDQARLDPKSEFKEIEIYGNEVEEFVKELSNLTIEQRTVLYELVVKCELKNNDHKTIYLSSARAQVEFTARENLVINSLVDNGLVELDREFSVSHFDPEFVALVMRYPSELELNIFAELKKFAADDVDLLQKMLISLNFDCLRI